MADANESDENDCDHVPVSLAALLGRPLPAKSQLCTCGLIPCLCTDGETFIAAREEEPLLATSAAGGLLLNPGESDEAKRQYLNLQLSRYLKPHQRRGVRFLWARSVETRRGHGCVLADHMGLGKTLQLVAVLRAFFGRGTQRETALVVAPAFVLQNWLDEVQRWLPRDQLVRARTLPSAGGAAARLAAVRDWRHKGGTLLLGCTRRRTLRILTASLSPFGYRAYLEGETKGGAQVTRCSAFW
mmetsp:Transcript_29081/g.86879  ORF Transcript_29081/g.86879 Transcript_29081/m.86879 type:complete len:243 (-) Transcript_29081:2088-2816(-)